MPKYNVDMQFIFNGTFTVEAKDAIEAEEFVTKHCGLVIGDIHSSLPEDDINWDFAVHPVKEIINITKIK